MSRESLRWWPSCMINQAHSMAWPGFRVRPSAWSMTLPSGATVSMSTARSGLKKSLSISEMKCSIHSEQVRPRIEMSPRFSRSSCAVTMPIISGPIPFIGRNDFAGITPGVKLW